jgi:hypothetical protein
MLDSTLRSSWKKRFLWSCAACVVFVMLFVIAVRVTVNEMFRTIETPKRPDLQP